MPVYWNVFKYFSLRMLYRPFSILIESLLRIESVIFLILFWGLVSASTKGTQINFSYIIAYFFISRFINELVMASHMSLGNVIRKHVKNGTLSQYMIKPVNISFYIYSELLGERGILILLNLVFFIVGIILLGKLNIISITLFVINLLCAIFTSLAFNLFLSAYAVGITYKGDIKNVFNHINRLLSGSLVPLSYFPHNVSQILLFLPFQNMIYGPTNALSTYQINNGVILQTGVSIIWTVLLYCFANYLWNKSLKNYDAVGI